VIRLPEETGIRTQEKGFRNEKDKSKNAKCKLGIGLKIPPAIVIKHQIRNRGSRDQTLVFSPWPSVPESLVLIPESSSSGSQ
jgi:hypothetical protein